MNKRTVNKDPKIELSFKHLIGKWMAVDEDESWANNSLFEAIKQEPAYIQRIEKKGNEYQAWIMPNPFAKVELNRQRQDPETFQLLSGGNIDSFTDSELKNRLLKRIKDDSFAGIYEFRKDAEVIKISEFILEHLLEYKKKAPKSMMNDLIKLLGSDQYDVFRKNALKNYNELIQKFDSLSQTEQNRLEKPFQAMMLYKSYFLIPMEKNKAKEQRERIKSMRYRKGIGSRPIKGAFYSVSDGEVNINIHELEKVFSFVGKIDINQISDRLLNINFPDDDTGNLPISTWNKVIKIMDQEESKGYLNYSVKNSRNQLWIEVDESFEMGLEYRKGISGPHPFSGPSFTFLAVEEDEYTVAIQYSRVEQVFGLLGLKVADVSAYESRNTNTVISIFLDGQVSKEQWQNVSVLLNTKADGPGIQDYKIIPSKKQIKIILDDDFDASDVVLPDQFWEEV